jgi:hypothetical protein
MNICYLEHYGRQDHGMSASRYLGTPQLRVIKSPP